MTANLLNPKYRGHKLTNDQMIQVHNFLLDNVDRNAINQLDDYKSGKGMFSKLFEKEINETKSFWNTVKPECPELAEFALKILHIPAAGINFSGHFVKENQLSDKKLDQLISLYYDLRIRDSNQSKAF